MKLGHVIRYKRPTPTAYAFPKKLYAVAVVDGRTKVFEFEDDQDGYEQLCALIRADRTLAVIHGERVPFEERSVATVAMHGVQHTDEIVLSRDFL